jgi:nanoRNase/pAp phosphatase (c-di-AMP/oligoRNAs hydrolase)
MVSRVVLGCGAIGERLVLALADRDEIALVVTRDESRADRLRESNVDATVDDPADPDVLAALPDAEAVVVATDDPAENVTIARHARDRYVDSFLLAYAGADATAAHREALADIADDVVASNAGVVDSVTEQISGDRAEDARRFRTVIDAVEGTLAVVMHDNPDPDAIASAVALASLAETLGTPAEPCYFGDISHQENRAFVNVLDLELTTLDPDADPRDRFGGFALVDHSRPGVNDQLPPDLDVDVVIDHHPPRGAVPGAYRDIRPDVGSTSTLLVDHFDRYGSTPDATVATALLFGIRVDTENFAREVSALDFKAAASILPTVDAERLERIESPNVSADTMTTLAAAIENREVRGSVLVSSAGRINDRDALPQAADKLLTMEGVTTVLVYGVGGDDVYMSARARGADVDLGETLRVAFDHIGSAGGHADMAGAQIPITPAFGEFEDDDAELAAIEDVVTESFFDAIQDRPSNTSDVDPTPAVSQLHFDPPVDGDD